jgi:pSer/pThr/pTyr-binding forkhead associated (FHA) protein
MPSADLRLVLKCANSGRIFAAPLSWGAVVVGRAGDGAAPTIDLTPVLSGSHGVSRMHAAFCLNEGALYIQDLDSTNGTRINGFRIEPKRLYLLRNGDEVEFGRARLSVSLLRMAHPSARR